MYTWIIKCWSSTSKDSQVIPWPLVTLVTINQSTNQPASTVEVLSPTTWCPSDSSAVDLQLHGGFYERFLLGKLLLGCNPSNEMIKHQWILLTTDFLRLEVRSPQKKQSARASTLPWPLAKHCQVQPPQVQLVVDGVPDDQPQLGHGIWIPKSSALIVKGFLTKICTCFFCIAPWIMMICIWVVQRVCCFGEANSEYRNTL